MISFCHSCVTIARYSFHDLVRQRILYNIFFVSLFLLFFGYIAALLVYGHQDRVMLHFGTMVNALSVFVVSAGAGARALRVEVESRSCYLTLSRPISRPSYFFGKWLGIVFFSGLNIILLSVVLIGGLRVTGGHANLAFLESVVLMWCETTIISALALFLSLFFRQGLSAMICIAYFFLSHNHEQMDFLIKQGSDTSGMFSFIKLFTPNAQALLMDTRVYYDMPLSLFELGQHCAYGFLWTAFFLLLGNAVFYRKNL
jgi:ABC-type transport system involved in multi-copper enzyme maturation permease subunit